MKETTKSSRLTSLKAISSATGWSASLVWSSFSFDSKRNPKIRIEWTNKETRETFFDVIHRDELTESLTGDELKILSRALLKQEIKRASAGTIAEIKTAVEALDYFA